MLPQGRMIERPEELMDGRGKEWGDIMGRYYKRTS